MFPTPGPGGEDDDATGEGKGKNEKKRKIGHRIPKGAWSAFCSERLRSGVGLTKGMSANFNEQVAQGTEAAKRWEKKGKEAISSANLGNRRPFGPTKQETTRAAARAVQQAAATRRRRMEEAQETALAEPVSAHRGSVGSLADALTERRVGAQKRKREEQDNLQLVEEFRKREGPIAFSAVCAHVPAFEELGGPGVQLVADDSLRIFRDKEGADLRCAKQVCSWALRDNRGNPEVTKQQSSQEFRDACLADFAAKCAPITHKRSRPIPAEVSSKNAKKRKKPPCPEVQMCLCSESGHNLWRFRNAMLQQVKYVCRPHSPNLEALRSSRVILLLSGERPEHRGTSSRSLRIDRIMGRDRGGAEWGMLCWHIGDMSLSPYSPTIQELLLRKGPEGSRQQIVVEATNSFVSDPHCFKNFELSWKWKLSMFFL